VTRFVRCGYSIYSPHGVITSGWFLAPIAICFAWSVLGPIVLSWLSHDDTDGIS
jgi:hypothetical protein